MKNITKTIALRATLLRIVNYPQVVTHTLIGATMTQVHDSYNFAEVFEIKEMGIKECDKVATLPGSAMELMAQGASNYTH